MDVPVLAYLSPLLAVALVGLVVVTLLRATGALARQAGGVAARRLDLPSRRRERAEVLRRCDACGRGWGADGSSDPGLFALWLRREVRRRARARGADVPRWSRPSGWSRCPSCLSRRVRTSGDPPLAPARGRAAWTVVAGGAAAVLGVLLLTVAVLGLLSGGDAP